MMLLPPDSRDPDEILSAFLDWVIESGIEPYDHQEEAILALFADHNVILNTPTGSGKSLVALAVQYKALCLGRRSYYTVPIKALANEKFLSLCKTLGAENVGMITGDATINAGAPVICCTAEILANLALRDGADSLVDDVIMDEFHYYSDRSRGAAWQIPLLTLPGARFLLMSATLGETAFFVKELKDLTKAEVTLVQSSDRPVPLHFEYSETQLEEKIATLSEAGRAPIYLVHFTQLACSRTAQALLSTNFCTKDEKAAINEALVDADFSTPYGKELKKLVRHGLAIHHAGLLPRYRLLVEKLAQQGLLKVICGTDTLGVGVNVPIRTVVFTQLCKYDGSGTSVLTVRDFQQIAGRAGRRGYDTEGHVVAQAPEHIIENLKMEAKAAANPAKKRKIVKRKPPERGYVAWSEETFRKLIDSPSEALKPSFQITPALLLNVFSRSGEDTCRSLRDLIESSHQTADQKRQLRKQARKLFFGLLRAEIFQLIPGAKKGEPKVQLNIDLQHDFSLNQALGLYLIATIEELDPEADDYALNVLSLIEAILENPDQILRAQTNKAKDALIGEMKADGVEYDERMERLQEVSYPKPGEDFIYETYNRYRAENRYLATDGVRPKSIAREMAEAHSSFEDYIKTYGLERSEAVLLRHLGECYKVLAQTVPPAAKTEGLEELESYLRDLVKTTDATLLEEWEAQRELTAKA